MAEVAAAAYAAETALEGAALGAFTVSRPTAPLHLHFHKLQSLYPNKQSSGRPHALARSSHSLDIVKGKAYIFGGDGSQIDNHVHVITLPSDAAIGDVDYQVIAGKSEPLRPLQRYAKTTEADLEGVEDAKDNDIPRPRAAHASTSIDDTIYIFGGASTQPSPQTQAILPSKDSRILLDERGVLHAFSTTTHTWTSLRPHPTKCSKGVPAARIHASCASTVHPRSRMGQEAAVQEHGTVFLHGGYDSEGNLLRDLWAFDVPSRVWSRWPDLPLPSPEDTSNEGRIVCTESKIYHVGDGFGTIHCLDVVRDEVDDGAGLGELGVSPKSGTWETMIFGNEELKKDSKGAWEGQLSEGVNRSETLPIPRTGYGFLPISTGAGREYLLLIMGADSPTSTLGTKDIWSFQIQSDNRTGAKLKDRIRDLAGYPSGENNWAKCEVVEATKTDTGPLELPTGLSRFACDSWKDMGPGAVVLYGGMNSTGEIAEDGWIVEVQA